MDNTSTDVIKSHAYFILIPLVKYANLSLVYW